MRKKLSVVGNSLALVIDKSLRQMMMVGPSHLVEVRSDGRRLIVEAVPEPAPNDHATTRVADDGPLPLAIAMDARRIASDLWQRYGMTPKHLARLHARPPARLPVFVAACDETALELADAETLKAVRRMFVCHQQLAQGRGWEEAIAVALYAVPLAPTVLTAMPATDQVVVRGGVA